MVFGGVVNSTFDSPDFELLDIGQMELTKQPYGTTLICRRILTKIGFFFL
jgi:hypothetical protein